MFYSSNSNRSLRAYTVKHNNVLAWMGHLSSPCLLSPSAALLGINLGRKIPVPRHHKLIGLSRLFIGLLAR